MRFSRAFPRFARLLARRNVSTSSNAWMVSFECYGRYYQVLDPVISTRRTYHVSTLTHIRELTVSRFLKYFRHLNNGYHSDLEPNEIVGNLPCRMHLCLVCNSIFSAGFQATVAHCDSSTHRNRLTDVLNLDAPLGAGIKRTCSPNDLLNGISTLGFSAKNNSGLEIPPSREEAYSSSGQTSPSSSVFDVDLSSLFSKSMNIAEASEAEYNCLLGGMRNMGLS